MVTDLESHIAESWAMEGISLDHFATRENEIYRAEWKGKLFAIKLARPAYHDRAALLSELQFTAYLAEQGVSVAKPVANAQGDYLDEFEGRVISISGWLAGRPLSDLAIEIDQGSHLFKLGANLAKLHEKADAWTLPESFVRPSWGIDGLLGEAPFWGRFWAHHALEETEKQVVESFRNEAREMLDRLDLDFGLIHADAVRENVFIDNGEVTLIDFDDFGFGYRLFDLATALLKNDHAPEFDGLKTSLIDGYQSERELDIEHLPLFMALRASTYLGWIMSRSDQDTDGTRAARYKQHALKYIREWRNS